LKSIISSKKADKAAQKVRKTSVRQAKDELSNTKRAVENVGIICIVCGREIKKGQPIRMLPKDQSCKDDRVYHLRTCRPGSSNWETFKANGKRAPKTSPWTQLSLTWNR